MFSFSNPKDIGIDLGTANTLIYEKAQWNNMNGSHL